MHLLVSPPHPLHHPLPHLIVLFLFSFICAQKFERFFCAKQCRLANQPVELSWCGLVRWLFSLLSLPPAFLLEGLSSSIFLFLFSLSTSYLWVYDRVRRGESSFVRLPCVQIHSLCKYYGEWSFSSNRDCQGYYCRVWSMSLMHIGSRCLDRVVWFWRLPGKDNLA